MSSFTAGRYRSCARSADWLGFLGQPLKPMTAECSSELTAGNGDRNTFVNLESDVNVARRRGYYRISPRLTDCSPGVQRP